MGDRPPLTLTLDEWSTPTLVNPREIILTRLDRLTTATWRHGLSRLARQPTTPSMDILNRIPIDTTQGIPTSIADVTWMGRHPMLTS